MIRYRPAVILLVLMAFATYRSFGALNSELSSLEDRGSMIAVMSAPEGSSIEYTDRYAAEIEKSLAAIAGSSSYFMVVAPGLERPNPVNSALAFVRPVP